MIEPSGEANATAHLNRATRVLLPLALISFSSSVIFSANVDAAAPPYLAEWTPGRQSRASTSKPESSASVGS